MIVDVHTHTPMLRDDAAPRPPGEYAAWRPDRPIPSAWSWAEYARDMAGVDVSIVFNIAIREGDPGIGLDSPVGLLNESTADFVADDPVRRIGFMAIHPDDPGVIDEIDRCHSDLGLQGIKLGANYQDFDPLGTNAHEVYRAAVRLRIPIMFHQGTSPVARAPIRLAHPLLMDEVAIAHPKLVIVMAHLGHPWQTDTLMVVRKHPNVWSDVSAGSLRPWGFHHALRTAMEWNVLDKLLFGTDYPITTPDEVKAALRRVNEISRGCGLEPIPEAALEAIIDRDALAALHLDRPTAGRVG